MSANSYELKFTPSHHYQKGIYPIYPPAQSRNLWISILMPSLVELTSWSYRHQPFWAQFWMWRAETKLLVVVRLVAGTELKSTSAVHQGAQAGKRGFPKRTGAHALRWSDSSCASESKILVSSCLACCQCRGGTQAQAMSRNVWQSQKTVNIQFHLLCVTYVGAHQYEYSSRSAFVFWETFTNYLILGPTTLLKRAKNPDNARK